MVSADVFRDKVNHRAKCKAVWKGTQKQEYREVGGVVRAAFYTQFRDSQETRSINKSNRLRERIENMHFTSIN